MIILEDNVYHSKRTEILTNTQCCHVMGGAVAQSVERATPGQEVPDSITAVAARSLLVGSVSV